MNLDEIRRRLPMYVIQEPRRYVVKMGAYIMGILSEDPKVYYKAICCHNNDEYARRDKFLSFFTYTKLITLDDNHYRETLYELHGFKHDYK